MNTSVSTRPYFLWDYDLTENDVREILHGDNEIEKIWMMSRILASARFEDVWKYIQLSEVVATFPRLKMRQEIKNTWKFALTAWGYHV